MGIEARRSAYLKNLRSRFGTHLLFVGLQGSYGRGRATENSGIDTVVILDRAVLRDPMAYGTMPAPLPNREEMCGFISGRQELCSWERSDLFQFCHDTVPVFGSIGFLL